MKELYQIKKNQTWELVPRTKDMNVIGTKWIFKNKFNEHGHVTRNKATSVYKVYAQVEGVDFEENFAPMERLKAIRMFLVFSCYKNFNVYPYCRGYPHPIAVSSICRGCILMNFHFYFIVHAIYEACGTLTI